MFVLNGKCEKLFIGGSSTLIQLIERNFQLVLVSAYFDQGLCYLRRDLCWTFDDIVYFNQRRRSHKPHFSEKERTRLYAIIKKVIPVYVKTYEYFKKKFEQKMALDNIEHDLRILREKKKAAAKRCLSKAKFDPILSPTNQPVPLASYRVNKKDNYCYLLGMPFESLSECLQIRERNKKCEATVNGFRYRGK